MNRPHAIPVFVTLAFVLGMSVTPFVPWHFQNILYGELLLFLVLVGCYFWAKRHWHIDLWFLGLSFISICGLGVLLTQIQQPSQNPQHYMQHLPDQTAVLELKVTDKLNPNPYQFNYLAELERINHQPVQGQVLLSIRHDSLPPPLLVGDVAVVYSKLTNIYTPRNPYQFDYAKYMRQKAIFKQIEVKRNGVYVIPASGFSVTSWAAHLRRSIDLKLEQTEFTPNQIALIEALLLGQRGEMTDTNYQHFIDAGVVHVLAVSGLHIGILLFFLLWVFKPLTLLPYGKTMRTIVVIVLLWIYAVLVGLSPSILRAVTMFSFLSLGLFFNRRSLTINMLCLSALVLLVYNPNFLYDVGFQLSYAAVLSILIFQKKLFKLFQFKTKVGRYIWGITSVTLSAQLGVLPLSLFYFHQFPGLFFISNLLIIPFIGVIIEVGVIVLLLLGIDHLPTIMVQGYGWILDVLQGIVDWVAQQEEFIIRHLYFSPAMLVISVVCLVALGFAVYRQKRLYWLSFLMLLIALELSYAYEFKQIQNQHVFYVFHKTRHTVLGVQNGHQFVLLTDSSLSRKKAVQLAFVEGIQNEKDFGNWQVIQQIQNSFIIGKQRIFVIDSFGIWRVPQLRSPDILLLRQSPKINLERVIDSLHPQSIIADGSNYKNMITRWRMTCKEKKIPFHYTGKKGFAKLNY